MRRSMPRPLATTCTSAPSASHTFEISLMNEILVARKQFDEYLMSSAVSSVVMTIGVSIRNSGSCSFLSSSCDFLVSAPMTTRSGRMNVSMAEPSRRNSGFDATSNSAPRLANFFIHEYRSRAVPTGAVLFCTTSV